MSTCRSCGAEVLWVYTLAGRRMPVDAEAQERLIIKGTHADDGTPVVESQKTYVSHFATCPQASQWRKSG